tara:strand:- start:606 stop:1028 length:423 start_codon:yes stop_codon:yes gene_type:complete
MLDYMSDNPAPPPEERKKNLIEDFKKCIMKKTSTLCKFNKYKNYNKYISDISDDICGINGCFPDIYVNPGSMSGYFMFSRNYMLKVLKLNITKEYEKISLQNVKDKLQIALILYNNKEPKRDSELSFDIIEKICLSLNFN